MHAACASALTIARLLPSMRRQRTSTTAARTSPGRYDALSGVTRNLKAMPQACCTIVSSDDRQRWLPWALGSVGTPTGPSCSMFAGVTVGKRNCLFALSCSQLHVFDPILLLCRLFCISLNMPCVANRSQTRHLLAMNDCALCLCRPSMLTSQNGSGKFQAEYRIAQLLQHHACCRANKSDIPMAFTHIVHVVHLAHVVMQLRQK